MKTFVCLILYEEKLKCRETKWNKKNENCHVSGVSEISSFFPCTIFGQDQIQFKDETQICDENEFIFIRIGLRSKSE